ncbi:MAG TPA: YwhD family protein [Limnochordia bacterium]|nr:YwhD family protein [Limnochordia bacterium]
MSKPPRNTTRIENAACPDESDPNALKIVSNKESFAGKSTALTAVLVDESGAWFEEAAVHARSSLEHGVEWCKSLDEVPDPKPVFVCWVYVKPVRSGQYTYHGVMACEMFIDRAAMKGFKRLGNHVDRLQAAIAGRFDLSPLDDGARARLAAALASHEGVLEASAPELRAQLDGVRA